MTLPAAFLDRPIAHRALHGPGRAENTHDAVAAAISAGYGIEIDIQPSRDGVPMVFHDYDLARLTGQSGPIMGRMADDLTRLPLLGGGGTIPTLAEILKQVAGQVPLLVEVKDQDGALGPNVGLLEEAIAREIATYDGDLALMSFNPHSATALAGLCPDRPVGLVTCAFDAQDWPTVPAQTRDRLARIPDFDTSGACFISHQHSDLHAAPVAALRSRGVPILCWTIRSPEQERAARDIADNITFEGYDA